MNKKIWKNWQWKKLLMNQNSENNTSDFDCIDDYIVFALILLVSFIAGGIVNVVLSSFVKHISALTINGITFGLFFTIFLAGLFTKAHKRVFNFLLIILTMLIFITLIIFLFFHLYVLLDAYALFFGIVLLFIIILIIKTMM